MRPRAGGVAGALAGGATGPGAAGAAAWMATPPIARSVTVAGAR